MVYPDSLPQLGEDLWFLAAQVGRDKFQKGGAHHLFRHIAEYTPGRHVPAGDYTLQVFADNGVIRRLDNGTEHSALFFRKLKGRDQCPEFPVAQPLLPCSF